MFALFPFRRRPQLVWLVLLLGLFTSGCSTALKLPPGESRRFNFTQDTLAYANELKWEYKVDPTTGEMRSHRREPTPKYTLHCFSLTRTVRQFYQHARFAPGEPLADTATYQKLLRELDKRSPRKISPGEERTVIPGYADLKSFSAAHEDLLKAELGGVSESYWQRGHWRMLFPFTRGHQAAAAEQLRARLEDGIPPVVHVVRFPSLTINHALLIYHAEETAEGIRFAVYDPNAPQQPTTLSYRRDDRSFYLPANEYFKGGRVDVYEVYHQWNY